MRLLSFIVLGLTGVFYSSCVSIPRSSEPFVTRLFEGTYDDVWLASLKALNDYPLKLSNKDAGRISSEVINGPYNELLFTHPEPIQLPDRFRFSLKFNFGRLESNDHKSMIRIRVVKELEQFQDFYSGWTNYQSDGLEERLVLYRIEHILAMERSLASQPPTPPIK